MLSKENMFYATIASAIPVEKDQRTKRIEETRTMLEWVDKAREHNILEIGSNLGYFTGLLAKKTGAHVVGIDTNTSKWIHKIAQFRNINTDTSFVQGQNFSTPKKPEPGEEDKVTGLPFKSGAFDQIILSHVIEHFEDPTQLLNEIKRVLTSDGKIIVAVPREKILGENTPDHKVLYESMEQLISQLESFNFKVLKQKDFGLGKSAVVLMQKMSEGENTRDMLSSRPSVRLGDIVYGINKIYSKGSLNREIDDLTRKIEKTIADNNLTASLEALRENPDPDKEEDRKKIIAESRETLRTIAWNEKYISHDDPMHLHRINMNETGSALRYGKDLWEAIQKNTVPKKLEYAIAFEKLGKIMGQEAYGELLRTLNTTPEAITELIRKAKKENTFISRIKKIFR